MASRTVVVQVARRWARSSLRAAGPLACQRPQLAAHVHGCSAAASAAAWRVDVSCVGSSRWEEHRCDSGASLERPAWVRGYHESRRRSTPGAWHTDAQSNSLRWHGDAGKCRIASPWGVHHKRHESVNGNQVRKGDVLRLASDDRLWVVKGTRHVKPGKGPAYMQLELKGVDHDAKKNERLRVNESVEKITIADPTRYTYLYSAGRNMVLMDDATFDQIEMPEELLGVQLPFLTDGASVDVVLFEGAPMRVTLAAKTATLVIDDTGPNLKKESDTDSGKPATLENGVTVRVPGHVMTGDTIEVKLEDPPTFVTRVAKR